METLLLSQQDVQASLSIPEVIQAVEEGYLAFHTGRVQQPDIVSLEVPAHSGETDIKSCYNPSNETMSVKIASGFYDNERLHGLPTMLGTILLLDGRTGAPLCVMDGGLITGIRTGAAGALSARLLARRDSRTVAVLGGGGQARMQIYCLAAVMDIQTVQVYSPRPEELPRYQADVEARTGLRVVPCATPAEAMNGADIAISTTPSTRFLVEQSMVEPGTHIVAVGADMPGKNEWDPLVFRGAKIVTDSTAQCLARGETRNAVQAGIITPDDICGEIGALLAGEKPGRENDREITIFDTTGMGVQDNVTAVRVYETARTKGLGQYFSFL